MAVTARDQYRRLCAVEPTIPLFSRDWWLDAAVGSDNWDVAVVEKDGVIQASMPYAVRKNAWATVLYQPPLTQTLGPWIRPSTAKRANRYGRQKDLMEALIARLPKYDHFEQNWHYSQTNWLPFYWAGFRQTTRYTYVLPDVSDSDSLWAGVRENIRTDIRKAQNRNVLRVRDDIGIDEFLRLNHLIFSRKGMPMPYSDALVRRLDEACAGRQCRKIWIAEAPDGRHHAGVYIVWSETSAYYLLGGLDPEVGNSGARSLCLWTAIRHAATVTRAFDFEGSMVEAIERYFRAFGAIQMPYFALRRTPSLRFRTWLALQAGISRANNILSSQRAPA